MNDEEREGIMADWRVMFWKKLEDRNIGPECLYNGDQSGLFYNKMPNRMYIDKHRRKSTNGVKAMKSKDEVAKAEAKFVKVAKSFSKRNDISWHAWTEFGVSPVVLKKAGIAPE